MSHQTLSELRIIIETLGITLIIFDCNSQIRYFAVRLMASLQVLVNISSLYIADLQFVPDLRQGII